MRWLITGGCGFLGTSVIKELAKDKENSFRVLDNLTVGTRKDLAGAIDFDEIDHSIEIPSLHKGECQLIIGDIRDSFLTNTACKNIDAIIHFAANTGVPNSVEDPRLDMECNVIGTFNMLEAARLHNVKRFVFASSGAPAGEVEPPIHEELPPHPVSPYGASKLAGEGYCSSYHKTFGIDTIALRFGNVYGPGSKHKSSVVAKFISLAMTGKRVEIYGDGSQTRDFIYIDDLVDAVIKAGTIEGIGGETFQIATARETTLNELMDILKSALKKHQIELDIKYGEKRLGDVMRNFSDTSKARDLLQWQINSTLNNGIEQTINYFKKL
ncbi:SDR family oxidoreductase [Cocleimonas flava]|uniref:UDP-glucose 4-epimerase n=1 Tax=Cocleimonas flava TaxID=634765 RepID=A0A4R1F486_9GAMM|nr:NAD-dependent epimerase/dehydratase family protein [Cocleimonas flava]TCJ88633.1 UDP-glucose 4-epimerase [Cocleimonas flava]